MSDLEERLRRIEDRTELEDLVVRYFIASDDDDYDSIGATFSREAKFLAGTFEAASSRDQIVEFIRTERAKMGRTIHTPNFTLFTFESANRASGIVGAHIELARDGRSHYGALRYYDEYSRAENRWCIHRRTMRTLHIAPWEDVGTSMTAELPVRWPGSPPGPSDLAPR